MRACHLPPVPGVKQTPLAASIHNRTFAFVPNSASGDLSVIDADRWKIIDLNKATGGFGRVPLGALPEQISASSDGCRLMSANRGSCDLTLVDPSTLLAGVFNAEYGDVTIPSGNGVQRVVPQWAGRHAARGGALRGRVPAPGHEGPRQGNGAPLPDQRRRTERRRGARW